jgi:putative transposase
VARIRARIAGRRRDFLHKLFHEDHPREPNGGHRGPVRSHYGRNHSLARAISDASCAELRAMLEDKAGWYGRSVIVVDRFYPSSKTCSACGHLAASLPLNVREWACAACGGVHDRDVNAAKVILAAGLAVAACGDGVRPARA